MVDRTYKYMFVVFCAFAILFPLMNIYYIFPKFRTLAVSMAEKESADMARHMLWAATRDGAEVDTSMMSALVREYVKGSLDVSKIKIYSSDGSVTYSFPEGDTNGADVQSDYWMGLMRGEVYSKLKREGMSTAEGEAAGMDILETYVPIPDRSGGFSGAFEVYSRIGREVEAVKEVFFRASAIMLGFVLVLFFIVTVLLVRSMKSVGDADSGEPVIAMSPF